MMDGPDSAKRFVCDYLKKDLPVRLVRYRNHWNVPEEELLIPNGYKPYAPPSLEHMGDEMPVIHTIIISNDGMTRIDYNTLLDPIYRVLYSVRTFIWVKHDGLELTVRARDQLMTVVRASLLDHQCLSVAAEHANTEVKFDEGSMREEYSDNIPPLKGTRWAAGGYISYQMTIDEIVTRIPLGTVEEFDVTAVNGPRFLAED